MDAPSRRQPAAPSAANGRWQVRLLGAIEVRRPDGQQVRGFPTRPVAALLGRLALTPGRTHARETLIEELWPGVAPDVGRNRLRQALSVLKALLERGVETAGPLLLADRVHVRVADGVLDCDAIEFERAAQRGDREAALALYQGDLMPGHYLDWVNDARERLATLHEALAALPVPARAALPPVQTHGLPVYLTRAFGIAPSVGRLLAALAIDRLVTVHGPGGCGKTRLAVQAAQALAEPNRPPDPPCRRVVFVPLIDCESADQLVEAVAQAVGAAGSGPAAARVQAALFGEPALLVLDNAEQLQPTAPEAIAALLGALPLLRVLVTSRRLLGMDGEAAFALTGLSDQVGQRPTSFDGQAAAEGGSPAVSLFIDRARVARGSFEAEGADLAAIDDAMQRLDGLPLAIELAASRLRGLALGELLHQLSHGSSLDLLARSLPSPVASARHDSMRRVIQWSWSLLTTEQRRLMQALAVFGTPALPEAVAHVAGQPLGPVRDRLEGLLGLSMARSEDGGCGRHRWALLQPVREFVAEQFPADETRAARSRLCDWLVEKARSPDAGDAASERPQVLAALEAAVADGAPHQALTLALALRSQWDLHPMPLSTQQTLEHALRSVGDAWPASLRGHAHELLSLARGVASNPAEALHHAERAVALADDPRSRCLALARWMWASYFDGRFDADYDAAFAEGERCAQACGDLEALAVLLRMKMLIVFNLRLDFAQTEQLMDKAGALFERLGNRPMANLVLLSRATAWAWQGRNEQGLQLLQELQPVLASQGDLVNLMHCHRQQGRVLIRLRRFEAAARALRDSLRLSWRLQMMQGLAQTLLHLPEALQHEGDVELAARLQGFAVAHWDRLFPRLNVLEQHELKRSRRLMACRLGAGRVLALMLAGRSLSLQDALELAVPGLANEPGGA